MKTETALRKLNNETNAAKHLLENLSDILADDVDAVNDAIEGETDLMEAIYFAVDRMAALDGMVDALKGMQERLQHRQRRFSKQQEHLKTAIMVAMQEANLAKLELPSATISTKKVPVKAIIIEEADLPYHFLKTSVKPDLTNITKALKDGQEVPGATLSNGGQTIQIRRS